MVIKQQAMNNAAQLSLFMVNLSQAVMANSVETASST